MMYSKITSILFILLFFFASCKNETDKNESVNVPGSYYSLLDDNIKLFLPSYFEKYSANEYKNLILNIPDNVEKNIELKRFNFLKFSKGNVYYFKDVLSSTLVTAKVLPYFDFTRRDSSQMLGITSLNCNKYAEVINSNCEKITAGFSEKGKTKVFISTYKVSQQGHTIFNTIYFISSNHKSLMINFYSNNNVNYNAYIEKLVIK